MRCRRCLNDETVRGITFDSSGVCNFCRNYDEIREKLEDETALHQLFQERIDAVRGKHRYDAALGISGGKDSEFVLHELVRKHGLHVCTFTLDNGFLSQEAKNNIDKTVRNYGVDHEYITFDRAMQQRQYHYSMKHFLVPCIACSCGIEINYRPKVTEVGTRIVHLAHGDNMNIKGMPLLKAMNTMFRSAALRWMFSWLIHPDLALKFGAWWSGKSRKSHGAESITVDMLDYLVDYARGHKAHNANVELYIFGHMHLPHRVAIEGAEVLFLSDWSGMKAVYGAMTDDGRVELRDFEIYETIY